MSYIAIPCNCGHRACKQWHVWPIAVQHGVGFTEEQARAVASLLNQMESKDEPEKAQPDPTGW